MLLKWSVKICCIVFDLESFVFTTSLQCLASYNLKTTESMRYR